MRQVKIVNVEGRGEVTVKEVSVNAVIRAWQAGDRLAELKTVLADALDPSPEVIATWYPSEIDQVLEALMEVNQSFFRSAARLNLDAPLRQVWNSAVNELSGLFSALFRQAISESGNTAGAPS